MMSEPRAILMVNQTLLKLALKSRPKDSGFTMMEVLVAILVSFAFLMGTLQAMALNTYFQVKSEREAQAKFWIEEDQALASSIAGTASTTTVSCPDSSDATNGFGQELKEDLGITSGNVQDMGTRTLVNKNYRLVRVTSIASDKPDVLQITYRVGRPYVSSPDTDTDNDRIADNRSGNTSIIAESFIQLMPVDALSCTPDS